MLDVKVVSQMLPEETRERFLEVVGLTDRFCDEYLNDEYKSAFQKIVASLSAEGSAILSGKASGWACGLVYAVGRVNFLTDPSQTPHMKAGEIAAGFGVSEATMHLKYKAIRERLDLMPQDPDFTTASRAERNPLIWMLTVNGRLMDIRDAPRGAQVVAYEQGLIPYIPADQGQAKGRG